MSGFPIGACLATALGVLHWSPEAFWRATPHELRAALAGLNGVRDRGVPATRAEFEDLKARYPDR